MKATIVITEADHPVSVEAGDVGFEAKVGETYHVEGKDIRVSRLGAEGGAFPDGGSTDMAGSDGDAA